MIITEEHTSCMGALPKNMFARYETIFESVKDFLQNEYGSIAAFEHGILGQTVFHAHTHLLPFDHNIDVIIPEQDRLHPIHGLNNIQEEYRNNSRYLYVAKDGENWLVDPTIGNPGFFRNRFAAALGKPERGDWKAAQRTPKLVKEFQKDIKALEGRWKAFCQRR